MKALPQTDQTLLIRTDFSKDAVWREVLSAATQPGPEFREILGQLGAVHEAAGEPLDAIETNLHIVDDRDYAGATSEQLLQALDQDASHILMIIVDETAIRDSEHPVLIVDLSEEPGRTFRALPSCVFEIESNLSICNMDWEDFADNLDANGIYRGFGGGDV
jgi:hypothetical protein